MNFLVIYFKIQSVRTRWYQTFSTLGIRCRQAVFTLFLCVMIGILASGCVNGPIRYKTLGYRKYATTEFFKRSPFLVKPIGGLVGIPVDVGVVVLDTISRPICSLYFTSKCGMNLMGEGFGPIENIKYTYENEPYYLPLVVVMTPVACVCWYSLVFTTFTFVYTDKESYDLYGAETGLFKDPSESPTDDSQNCATHKTSKFSNLLKHLCDKSIVSLDIVAEMTHPRLSQKKPDLLG